MTIHTSGLFPESPPKHQPGAGQSEWEGEPDARQCPIENKTEEVACRKRDDEISDEGDVHHRLDIGDASEGIRVIALHPVSKLVGDEWNDEACY